MADWLLMMKWIEPAVRCPFRPERLEAFRHHAPGRRAAASPCSSSGRTCARLERTISAVDRPGELILLGAYFAEHHRIDDLEMRRVGRQRYRWIPVAVELTVRRGAEVILDVARAFHSSSGAKDPPLNSWNNAPMRACRAPGQHRSDDRDGLC